MTQKFVINFKGRTIGSSGKFQNFSVETEDETYHHAVTRLYKDYDHLHQIFINGQPMDWDDFVFVLGLI